jgi:hypothetical protein
MLTGHRLREITNEVKTWNDVASGMIPSARSVRPDLPDGFERLLARALAPEPSGRFPTAAAFGSEIRALLAQMNMPVGASDLQALLSIINPPRKLRSLMERSKVIRLGPEGQALEDAAKLSGVVPAVAPAPAPRGFVVPAPAKTQVMPSTTSTMQGRPANQQPAVPPPSPPRMPAPTLSGPPPPLAARRSGGVLPPISYAAPGQATIQGVPRPTQMPPRVRQPTPVGWPSPPAPSPSPSSPGALASTRTPSGPYGPAEAMQRATPPRPSPRISSPSLSAEAMAVAATLPAFSRPDPEMGRPPATELLNRRSAGLWPPVLVGTLALLALAGVAIHFVVLPLDVLVAWWEPAALKVSSDPPSAEVLVDGARISALTPAITSVKRDRYDHVLEVTLSGYRPVHQIIRYDRARILSFDVPLQKATSGGNSAIRVVPIAAPGEKERVNASPDAGSPGVAPATAASDAGAASDASPTAAETAATAAPAAAAAITDAGRQDR